jgi:hypothetical protein
MSDTNPAPAAGSDEALAPLNMDDGADALLDLLPDPETDLSKEDQGQQEATDESEAEGDEPKTDETEEATEEEEGEKEDGPQGYESGKFAADTANVRLKDGTVISVQDLKRGFLSQQSFTRGSQENAKEREALASQKTQTEQYARELQAHRDFLLQATQFFVPQAPDRALLDRSSPNYDPITYAAQKADYDDRIAILTQLQTVAQSEQERAAQGQTQQQKEQRDKEGQRLLQIMPELKKPEVYQKFWKDAVETMSEYGYSQEELDGLNDHRLYIAMRDLTAYRRARAKLPAVKEAIQSKPVLQGKRRMDTKEKTSRDKQARGEQLRATGSFDAGVSALMDLDL